MQFPQGLVFPYSSPLADLFNPPIARIKEAGVIEHLYNIYMPYRNIKDDFDALARASVRKIRHFFKAWCSPNVACLQDPIKIDHFYYPAMAFAGFLAASVASFLCEFSCGRTKKLVNITAMYPAEEEHEPGDIY